MSEVHGIVLGLKFALEKLPPINRQRSFRKLGQVPDKGEFANARARVATTRTALELQIGKNILAIASHHLGDRERAAEYFNQSLLEDPTRTNDDSTPAQSP